MQYQFPDDFLWGTSTAAAQVETASAHNWRGEKSLDGFIFDRTTDHEKRRGEDAGYIKQLGSIYRCGVDWAKLQSKPFAPFDPKVVREYQEFFVNLRKDGMQIMFVMHHFTNPLWFEALGGWTKEKNIPAFINYAQQCIKHFGNYTDIWNTFNEPNVYVLNAYILGNFPPKQKNYLKGNSVLQYMGRAHDIVYDLLKQHDPDKWVGISLNTAWFEGLNWLGKIPAAFTDWWFHRKAAHPFEQNDFWGISYYAHIPFTPTPLNYAEHPRQIEKLKLRHDKMWSYRPEGLARILRRFHKYYHKPFIITENGICTDDPQQRINSIKDYLKIIHRLIKEEQLDIRGYIHWSTWDNFEWHLGPTYRFGLVRVNFQTMERSMTEAGKFYASVCQNNGF